MDEDLLIEGSVNSVGDEDMASYEEDTGGIYEDPEELRAAEEEAFGPDVNLSSTLHEAVAAEAQRQEEEQQSEPNLGGMPVRL